jgi:glucan 1,3-beta-glucosidase
MTDCAPNLNGYGAGNRLEGSFPGSHYISSCDGKSGSVSSWSQDWKDDVRKYIEVQLDAYEAKTQGWVFWNFKTEGNAGEWDLFQLLDNGVGGLASTATIFESVGGRWRCWWCDEVGGTRV